MKKTLLFLIFFIAATSLFGQSNLTIGIGSSVSVGNGSNVEATNRDGTMLNSGYFNSRSIVLDPVTTAATSVSSTTFTANWNASSGANGYKIDVSNDINFGTFIPGYQNLDVGVSLLASVSGLNSGTTYYYRVRAYDIDGITGYSNVTMVVTAPAATVVSAAYNINESSFAITWSAVAGANKYYIDVATDIGFTSMVTGWANVNAGNVTTYTINTNLTAGTTYFFRARAANNYGISSNSNTITLLTAPPPPVAAAATSLASTSFSANWGASAGATKYYLDVSTANTFAAGTFVAGYQGLDVGAVTTYSVNTNLAGGTTYYYRVSSSNGTGISTNSGTIIVLTVPPIPVASAASSITQTSFSANWGAATSATKYYIDVATDNAFASPVAGWTNIDMGNVITYPVNSNLSAGITYYYRIRSENASGTSGNSNVITLTTIPPSPVTIAATAPTQTSFSANWNAASGTTGYRLDVSESNTFSSFVTGWNNVDVGNVTTHSVNTNLAAGTTYYYRVRGYNANGTSGSSNTTSLTIVPPDPVAAAASDISSTSFTANWNAALGATKYYIDVATDNLFTSMVPGWTNVDAGAGTSISVNSGLTSGTTYYYKVRSNNASGTSGSSGVITLLTSPVGPVATAASDAAGTSFTANWNAVAGAAGYSIDVSTNTNFDAGTFVTGYENRDVANVLTYPITANITEGTTYYYRVRSYNAGGASFNSNKITFLTLPASPVTQAATSVTSSGLTANWVGPASATGYRLDVSSASDFSSFVAGYNDLNVNNVTTYAVVGLTANTTYYYRVRAYNGTGTGGNSAKITQLTAPDKPVIAAATAIGTGGFTANWSATAGATGYYLDVSSTMDFSGIIGAYNSLDVGNVTSFVVTGLTSGTTYYYRVRAYSTVSPSVNSDSQTVLALSSAPSASAATAITSTSFDANWSASAAATGYRLDVSTDPAFGVNLGSYDNLDVLNVLTKSVTGLTAGTTYYYRIRAYNGSGTNGSSNVITVAVVPPAPSEQAATFVTTNGFAANWLAANGATGYKLDVSTVANFASLVSGYNNLDVGNVLTYPVTGLTAGTPYYYRIRTYNTGGTSGNSGSINPTTAAPVPAAPAPSPASSIAADGLSFSTNWIASTGATKYYLDVSTVSNFASFVLNWENIDVGNVTTKSVNTNITPGTTYYYRIRAFNASGTSGNSTTITLITTPAAPVVLAPLAPSVTNSGFDARWNSSTGATGYKLDVSTVAADFSPALAGYNGLDVGNVTTFTVTGLTGGTAYRYRVRAYNTGGESPSSGATDQTTAADPAGTLTATSPSNYGETSFRANWNTYTGATGYKIDVSTSSGFGAGTFVTGYTDLDVGNNIFYNVNTNLTAGTTYYYRVKAYDGGGPIGNTSNTISALTLPATFTANAPSGITQNSFTANWAAQTSATGYYLDVSTASDFSSFVPGYNNLDAGSATSYAVTGLADPGTTYYYRLRAKNASGTNNTSASNSVLLIPANPVSGSAGNVVSTSFSANWSASTGASKYYLDVSADPAFGSFVAGWNNTDVGNVLTYSVNVNINSGTTYYYRVRAYNTGGNSSSSGVISLTTAPDAPTANNASLIGKTNFTANWASSTGATKYFVDVATTNTFDGGTFVGGYQNLDAGNVNSILVSGLSQGITYYYRVRAFNSNGTSVDSGTKSALTLPAPPSVNPVTTVGATSFTASWNTVTGASKYYLDVSTVSNFATYVTNWQNVDVGNVVNKSVNTDLTAGTTYYFRVRAFNATGLSDNSETMTTETAPPAPVATAATSPVETSFVANWNVSPGATGYLLSVSTVADFASFVPGFNGKDVGNVTNYTVTGLTAGTTYYYKVISYTGSKFSPGSNTITALILPAASTATAATSIVQTSISANWGAVTGASGYYLDVATNNSFTSFVAGFNNRDVSNVTTYPVPGLSAITTYYYRVRAYNASGTGINSNTISALTVPAAPVATAGTSITNIAMTANWNTTAGATGYRLDVSTTNTFNAGTFIFGFEDLDVGNVTSKAVTGLNGSVTYYYRVRAYNTSGAGVSSGTITTATAADPSAPPVATAGTVLAQTSYNVNWAAVDRATGYKLDVATDMGFTNYVSGFQDLDVGNVITYPVTGLTGGTTYYYRSRSYNAMGTSSNSNVITVLTKPAAPTATAATALAVTSFTANWTSVTGAAGYRIDVATDAGFTTYVAGYQDIDLGNVLTTSITGLPGGTTYYYRIRAYNASGTGANSGSITALTVPPAPVSSAATTVTQTSFSANWAAATGAAKYYLDVSTASDFSAILADYNNKDVSNVITYSVTGLTASTTYYYRVRANNASGTSTNSGTIAIVGLPTANAATAKTESGFSANWTAVAGATKYYLDVSTASDFSAILPAYNNSDVGDVITSSVTGLTANTTYYYRVRANNASGTSGNSAGITVLTAPPVPVSTAATSITPTGFVTNWAASAGATGYYLDIATDNGFANYLTGYENKDVGNVITATITGIERGTTYYYRIRSYNASASSGNSAIISVLAAPAAGVATDIMQTSFSANWNSVSGATKYYLDVATDLAFTTFVGVYNNKDVGNVITINIPGLIKNTEYFYRVRSFDGTTTSGNSNIVGTRTLPDAPTATAATLINQNNFYANWNIPGGSAPGYKLDIATDIAFTNLVAGYDNLSVGNVLTYQVTGLIPGRTYYFRVRALNSWGSSDNSNIITVLLKPANPVTINATDITTNSFTANWEAAAGAAGYMIDVASDNAFTNMIAANLNAGNVTSWPVGGLTSNSTYYYRVRASNVTGLSGNSNIIAITTMAEKPVLSKLETEVINYHVKQSEIVITDSLIARCPGSTPIERAVIEISSNYTKGDDYLLFNNTGGIAGTFDIESGKLTLTGSFNSAVYQQALRSVRYYNNSLQPASLTKKFKVTANNGFFDSDPVERDIQINGQNLPPVLRGLEINKLVYLKGITGLRIPLTDSLVVEDSDNQYLTSAIVKISQGYIKAEDNLDFNNTSSLTGLFNKETGVLTITGKGTVLSYHNFVREVTYRNSSGANGTSSKKAFEFIANDGLVNSQIAIRQFELKSPLETPTGIAGTIVSNKVDVTWNDTNTGEDGYIIERSENNNTLFVELARVDSNSVKYTDADIKNGKTYYYRVAAYKGLLKSDYSDQVFVVGIVVGISDRNGIPKEYVISQNYPNPFNPATAIVYGVPLESKVRIEIYNSIGQLVDVPVDELKAPGYYKINWNAGMLASGIYIYRVTAASIDKKSNFIDIKRMVLVK